MLQKMNGRIGPWNEIIKVESLSWICDLSYDQLVVNNLQKEKETFLLFVIFKKGLRVVKCFVSINVSVSIPQLLSGQVSSRIR